MPMLLGLPLLQALGIFGGLGAGIGSMFGGGPPDQLVQQADMQNRREGDFQNRLSGQYGFTDEMAQAMRDNLLAMFGSGGASPGGRDSFSTVDFSKLGVSPGQAGSLQSEGSAAMFREAMQDPNFVQGLAADLWKLQQHKDLLQISKPGENPYSPSQLAGSQFQNDAALGGALGGIGSSIMQTLGMPDVLGSSGYTGNLGGSGIPGALPEFPGPTGEFTVAPPSGPDASFFNMLMQGMGGF